MGTEKKMGFLQVQVPHIWDYTEHDKPNVGDQAALVVECLAFSGPKYESVNRPHDMLLFWIEIKMTHLKHVCLFNFIRLAAVLLMQHTWS
jgi:hypothetical protein